MKVKIKVEKEVNIKYIKVRAGVRYWEDSELNGEEDTDGKMPLRDGDNWRVTIDVESGRILDWPKNQFASIHYKVCDDGTYTLIDDKGKEVFDKDGYVPNDIIPGEFGDYIILKIDGTGRIEEWEPDFSNFFDED